MSTNEALKNQFYYIWLEGNALYEQSKGHKYGTILHQTYWVQYLQKRVEYSKATGGGVDLAGLEEDLQGETDRLNRMVREQLAARFHRIRNIDNGPYIDSCLLILSNSSDPNEVDAYLERKQGEHPRDKHLQDLTNIVTTFIGETDPSLQP